MPATPEQIAETKAKGKRLLHLPPEVVKLGNLKVKYGDGRYKDGTYYEEFFYHPDSDSWLRRNGFGGGSTFSFITEPAQVNQLKIKLKAIRAAEEKEKNKTDPLGDPTVEPAGLEATLAGGRQADASKSLRYPADMKVDTSSDYVLFDFYKYKPPFQRKKNSFKTDGQQAYVINGTLDLYNSTGVAKEYFKVKQLPQILMYMPDDIQDAYKAGWEGKAFGTNAAGLLAAAGQKNFDKLKGFANTAGNAAKTLPVNAAASAVTSLIKNVTGDSITSADVFGGIGGVIRNPNVELLFQQHDLRTFDLTFKMSPYSKLDELNIEEIINIFRRAMLPSYDGEGGSVFGLSNTAIAAGFIGVPLLCRVAYMRGGSLNKFLPKYKMCAITDFSINYTPDNNYATFGDDTAPGGPVAYEMKISFMETKLIYAEDIKNGY